MLIKISMKGLAKFMTAGPAAQRKILRDYKFPKPEGTAQAMYYAEALRCIRNFHDSGNDLAVINATVNRFSAGAAATTSRASAARLTQNRRALLHYYRNFGQQPMRIVAAPSLTLRQGNVQIGARPDFCVQDKTTKLLKLDLGKDAPPKKAVQVVLQVLYQAAEQEGFAVRPQDVVYVDVRRAGRYKGARARSRMNSEIEAACRNIEALWPGI